jgi:hypothetical protein
MQFTVNIALRKDEPIMAFEDIENSIRSAFELGEDDMVMITQSMTPEVQQPTPQGT